MAVQKTNKLVAPVVKWVGGKRQLLPEIKKYSPKNLIHILNLLWVVVQYYLNFNPNKQ